MTRVSPNWLALREPADRAARARELVEQLQPALPATTRHVIHDLGCGTGSMGRWLAPLLTGPQHWVAHDRDPDLLALAATDVPGSAADGASVTVETRRTDLAQVRPRDFAGATLITASALLDVLTGDELATLARTCAAAECPVLLTLSVTGHVEISPPDALDDRVSAAFNAHQRRSTPRGRLLGPDAVACAVDQFRGHGTDVVVRPSPWRLHAAHAELIAAWFTGWVGAASEQDVALADECAHYTRARLDQVATGELAVTVAHADLLVMPQGVSQAENALRARSAAARRHRSDEPRRAPRADPGSTGTARR